MEGQPSVLDELNFEERDSVLEGKMILQFDFLTKSLEEGLELESHSEFHVLQLEIPVEFRWIVRQDGKDGDDDVDVDVGVVVVPLDDDDEYEYEDESGLHF